MASNDGNPTRPWGDMKNHVATPQQEPEGDGRDGCAVCYGFRGGKPGNENIIEGIVMCDFCAVTHGRIQDLITSPQQEPEGDGWDARRRARVTPEETQEAVDRLRTRVDPERGVCPKCGSPAMLEPLTRGGRPQIALCTNEACGWDGWIPDRAEAQQEPEGDGDELRHAIDCALHSEMCRWPDCSCARAVMRRWDSLRTPARNLTADDLWTEALKHDWPGDRMARVYAAIEWTIDRLRARVQPRRVSREEFEAVVKEIKTGYLTYADPDEVAVDVLDILGIEITPMEGDDRGQA